MAGTQVTVPGRRIDGTTTMTVAGRQLDILYYGQSASPGSIAVLDRASGVLFAGGLVSLDRIPDTKDARIATWLDALDKLKQLPLQLLVPGEGAPAPVTRVDELAAYLKALRQSVHDTYAQGVSLGDAGRQSELPAFAKLPLYRPAHNKNVEQLYLLLERATLNGQ